MKQLGAESLAHIGGREVRLFFAPSRYGIDDPQNELAHRGLAFDGANVARVFFSAARESISRPPR